MTKPLPPKTLADLMAATNLGEFAVKQAIKAGQLPGYKAGRFYVVPADAFEDFLHGRWVPLERPKLEPIRPIVPPTLMKRRAS